MSKRNIINRIGIDLGGTKIEGILLSNDKVIERKRIPTNRDKGYNSIIKSIASLVIELKNVTSTDVSIGICTPGAISPHNGRIKNSNTVCLIGKPFKEDVEKAIGSTIKMENDANCFTIAEAQLGAAKGYNMVFGVIIGTGVGGGIVVNGKIHTGRMNIAGEWGHHTLHPNGRDCYCGRNGCVEAYISGTALEKRWLELSGKTMKLPEIIALAENDPNNSVISQWKSEFITNFGLGLANVINILDPDVIVLGGGVSNIGWLYDEGVAEVYKNVFSDHIDTPILKNTMGDSAGVFGAAYL